jgi:hypothetical protein
LVKGFFEVVAFVGTFTSYDASDFILDDERSIVALGNFGEPFAARWVQNAVELLF